jgi:hypothetical protein
VVHEDVAVPPPRVSKLGEDGGMFGVLDSMSLGGRLPAQRELFGSRVRSIFKTDVSCEIKILHPRRNLDWIRETQGI